jgi:hypothetical protein
MTHRSTWLGICIGVLGLAMTLIPVSAASAKSHQGHHSSTTVKGSNPNSAMCKDVKAEQTSSTSVGQGFEKDLASGNFAQAKQSLLSAYNGDLSNVQKALAVIKTAPANVQSAFKNLLSFVQQIKNDIQNASNLEGLVTSFSSLGKNTQLVTDGTTIANWYASVCGGPLVTTTTATTGSIP